MQSTVVTREAVTLIGLSIRTNNQNEMNPETSKIADLAGAYWGEQIANQFHHRSYPGVTYAVYTDYESDENGEYTYFIGEVVNSMEGQERSKFSSIVIPGGTYQKLTTEQGTMPGIIIQAWQEIWQMTPEQFAGQRTYMADFEIYDERARDPHNAEVDIYLGVSE